MFITKDWVQEKGACLGGMKYFLEHWPEGAEYQTILDQLAKDNEAGYADWLMEHAGRTDAVMEVQGDLKVEGNIFFAGFIRVSGFLSAGLRIKAGEGIKAGEDFGIYAGLRLRISLKAKYALVVAKEVPKNLLLGIFKPQNGSPQESEVEAGETSSNG